ncbi:hypothetical protein NLJ89_g8965 [Agrocybe chaxingu]|uniref:BCS1 N-terminal domain-containing protein n=1 Tax=Agrocybe chaxingu TaxID=84603 RepID=A0A9W8JUF8_9AGAR|nr:hypothetical protein NLJ89_g8965 [Agrocybe chaxingu]
MASPSQSTCALSEATLVGNRASVASPAPVVKQDLGSLVDALASLPAVVIGPLFQAALMGQNWVLAHLFALLLPELSSLTADSSTATPSNATDGDDSSVASGGAGSGGGSSGLGSSILLRKHGHLLLFILYLAFKFADNLDLGSFLWDHIPVTATFTEREPAYDWMLAWIYSHKDWMKIRSMGISTSVGGNTNPAYYGEVSALMSEVSQRIYTLPTTNKTYCLKTDDGKSLHVIRREKEASLFTRNSADLFTLIQKARTRYVASQKNTVNVYYPDRNNQWRAMASRSKRPLSSIILEGDAKEKILTDVKRFLASRQWYNDRGIPYRRGYLFVRPSFIPDDSFLSLTNTVWQRQHGALELHVYNLPLSREGMDDGILIELVNAVPDRSILLLEDIDAAFRPRSGPKRDASSPLVSSESKQGGITLSGLLNVLDGISATEGRLLFTTTNHFGAIDPALKRRGRIDVVVEFPLANATQARELFRVFYRPPRSRTDPAAGTSKTAEATESETTAEATESETTVDAGVGIDIVRFSSEASPARDMHVSPHTSSGSQIGGQVEVTKMDDGEFAALLDVFGLDFPGDILAPADIQGYLLEHKDDPREAAEGFKGWVREELHRKRLDAPSADAKESGGRGLSSSGDVCKDVADKSGNPGEEVYC